ncbi:MAG TPA: hypothetical protein VFW93_13835 [Aquabacterium sp.]|nr:hypothetical protein [Aquabacterium sp.]
MRPVITAVLALFMATHALADSGDREQEQLRRLKLQLRQQQQEKDAAIQDAQAKASADKAALAATLQSVQVDVQAQRRAASAATRRVQTLESELNTLKQDKEQLVQQVALLQKTLEDSKAQAARQGQQAAAALASSQSRLQNVSDQHEQCRTQNAALYELGQDLLGRYERKGLVEVLTSQEPFIQTARVTLENTKAQYQDKLDAARLKPSAP